VLPYTLQLGETPLLLPDVLLRKRPVISGNRSPCGEPFRTNALGNSTNDHAVIPHHLPNGKEFFSFTYGPRLRFLGQQNELIQTGGYVPAYVWGLKPPRPRRGIMEHHEWAVPYYWCDHVL